MFAKLNEKRGERQEKRVKWEWSEVNDLSYELQKNS